MTDSLDTDTPAPEIADTLREPMLNIPPVTLALSCIIFVCFIGWRYFTGYFEDLFDHMIFIPANFTRNPLAQSPTLISYAFLHFNWAHLLVNLAGLIAFGSGIERMMGKRYVIGIFTGGAIVGVLGFWAFFSRETVPLIGASAGISAFFGALLPLIVKRPQILMTSILFIIINIALGIAGMPDNPMRQVPVSIAWQAHIAGFLFGELFVLGMIRYKFARRKRRNNDL